MAHYTQPGSFVPAQRPQHIQMPPGPSPAYRHHVLNSTPQKAPVMFNGHSNAYNQGKTYQQAQQFPKSFAVAPNHSNDENNSIFYQPATSIQRPSSLNPIQTAPQYKHMQLPNHHRPVQFRGQNGLWQARAHGTQAPVMMRTTPDYSGNVPEIQPKDINPEIYTPVLPYPTVPMFNHDQAYSLGPSAEDRPQDASNPNETFAFNFDNSSTGLYMVKTPQQLYDTVPIIDEIPPTPVVAPSPITPTSYDDFSPFRTFPLRLPSPYQAAPSPSPVLMQAAAIPSLPEAHAARPFRPISPSTLMALTEPFLMDWCMPDKEGMDPADGPVPTLDMFPDINIIYPSAEHSFA